MRYLPPALLAVLLAALCSVETSATPATIVRVSTNAAGDPVSAYYSALSDEGQHIVFVSYSSDAVANDTNGGPDIFFKDLNTGEVERINVGYDGSEAAWDEYYPGPAMSSDGRYVAFVSSASNLVPNDTNNARDVFVRDTVDDSTVMVSVTNAGAQRQTGSGGPITPGISGDGRFVVFDIDATDLAPDGYPGFDVYLHDRDTDTDGVFDEPGAISTEIISNAPDGSPADENSRGASISSDGSRIVYTSTATNLVDEPQGCQGCTNVFLYDRDQRSTQMISVSPTGDAGNSSSDIYPTLDEDGDLVAFSSFASNLVPDDTNGVADIFVRSVALQTTERVSQTPSGAQGDGASCRPFNVSIAHRCISMSSDGEVVAFVSSAGNLSSGDTNCQGDIFVYTRSSRLINKISVDSSGGQLNHASERPDLTADGSAVAFWSYASDLIPSAPEDRESVYVSPVTSNVASVSSGSASTPTCFERIGDVDCSGVRDIGDIISILRYEVLSNETDCLVALGNVDCYWRPSIDTLDALALLWELAGLTDGIPPYCPFPWETFGGK